MLPADSYNFVITLLNVRSLKKHAIDLRYDKQIHNSDILALTETIISPFEDISPILNTLNCFQIIQQDHWNSHLSLAFCYRPHISIHSIIHFAEVNGYVIEVQKNQHLPKLSILLLYRPHSMSKDVFLESWTVLFRMTCIK